MSGRCYAKPAIMTDHRQNVLTRNGTHRPVKAHRARISGEAVRLSALLLLVVSSGAQLDRNEQSLPKTYAN